MNKSIVYIITFLSLLSCSNEKFEAQSDNRFLMGTVCILTLYNNEPSDIFDGAFSVIENYELLLSLQKENSEVSQLNDRAGQESFIVSDDVFTVVKKALSFAAKSNGAFDPTIAPLVKLWGIGENHSSTPPLEELIIADKSLIGYKNVELNEGNSVFLKKKGMKIDLGGIAKGYIADKVKEYLLSQGVQRGIINLGGNILVLGSKPESQSWQIGIQNPFDSRGNYIGIAEVIDKTIVTSGIYERYFFFEGKRYHHILDPVTGYPVENDLASVTIIADQSIDADALSTSLFILGVEEGLKLIEETGQSEAVFVTKDKNVIYSSGADLVFYLYNGEFSIISLDEYLDL